MSDFAVYNNIPRIMPAPSMPKAPTAGTETDSSSFGGALKDAIQQVDGLQQGSQGELQKYLTTDDTDLHSVMIALEKADTSFQMMMQVRNKIVQAYQDIMKTQV
jgi:flagellar hook-basal body complex protein FliE